jgi:hypothetical protein
MFKTLTLFTVLLMTVTIAGCNEKETAKTDSAPPERSITINNPPPAPAQNTTTVIHDRTVVHDAPVASAAPPANVTIINNQAAPSPTP